MNSLLLTAKMQLLDNTRAQDPSSMIAILTMCDSERCLKGNYFDLVNIGAQDGAPFAYKIQGSQAM